MRMANRRVPRVSDSAILRGLYAVTPDDPLLPRLSALVGMALAGGARLVQFRNKTAPRALKRALAAEMLRICHAAGAKLIVNDDLVLALDIGADGVHLGREDGDFSEARRLLGDARILGVSCYDSLEMAETAANCGADYLAFGSVFDSRTKPAAVRAPLELLAAAKRRFGLPVAAIGGITLTNAGAALAAGADMLAVVSDLFDAMNIKDRASAYQQLFVDVPSEATP